MGATGKFIWPIPDKGLKKRIHRITAPTLLLWGEHDRLVPRAYAEGVRGEDRRHAARGGARAPATRPIWSEPDATARAVQAFLKA